METDIKKLLEQTEKECEGVFGQCVKMLSDSLMKMAVPEGANEFPSFVINEFVMIRKNLLAAKVFQIQLDSHLTAFEKMFLTDDAKRLEFMQLVREELERSKLAGEKAQLAKEERKRQQKIIVPEGSLPSNLKLTT